MRSLLLSVLALSACGVTVIPTCEVTEEVYEDFDEVGASWTLDDLDGVIGSSRTATGQDVEGSATDVTVSMSRAEGPFTLYRSVASSVEQRNNRLFGGRQYTFNEVVCFDSVGFAVDLSIDSDPMTFDAEVEAGAGLDVDGESLRVSARVELAPDDPRLPDFNEAISDAPGDPDRAWVSATLGADETGGSAGWEGDEEDDDILITWAEYLLSW